MKFMEVIPHDATYLTSLTKKLAPPLGNILLGKLFEMVVIFLMSLSSFSDSVVC